MGPRSAVFSHSGVDVVCLLLDVITVILDMKPLSPLSLSVQYKQLQMESVIIADCFLLRTNTFKSMNIITLSRGFLWTIKAVEQWNPEDHRHSCK